jgi:hypothetical protein
VPTLTFPQGAARLLTWINTDANREWQPGPGIAGRHPGPPQAETRAWDGIVTRISRSLRPAGRGDERSPNIPQYCDYALASLVSSPFAGIPTLNDVDRFYHEAVQARDNVCAGWPLRPYPPDIIQH